ISDQVETDAQKRNMAAFGDGSDLTQSYADGIKSKAAAVAAAAQQATRDQLDFEAAVKEGLDAGGATALAYAQGILDQQSEVDKAFAALINQEKTELTRGQEEAKLVGQLTSKELASGLKDGR